MTSRERIESVLRHETPDVLPNCWGGCETAGLHVLAYRELIAALGLPARPARVDTFMFNAVMDEDALLKMRGDMLLIASPLMCSRPLRAKEGWRSHTLFGAQLELTDDYDVRQEKAGTTLFKDGIPSARCPLGGTYFDSISTGDMFDYQEVPAPSDYRPRHSIPDELLRDLEDVARNAYERTDFALCMGETLTDLQLTPGGMIAWYAALINEPEITDEYLSKAVDAALDQLTGLDQAVGKYVSVLSIAHDLGDNRGVTMGASLFRKRYKPHYMRLFSGWHRRTRMKINLHSCGAVGEIIPDLIECGVDVLNPVQVSASGMDAAAVRRLAGDKLVLYGGALDCIQTPANVEPDAVYRQVKDNILALAKNGNYLFAGVHNTVANTPISHIQAALRAYDDLRDMYKSK